MRIKYVPWMYYFLFACEILANYCRAIHYTVLWASKQFAIPSFPLIRLIVILVYLRWTLLRYTMWISIKMFWKWMRKKNTKHLYTPHSVCSTTLINTNKFRGCLRYIIIYFIYVTLRSASIELYYSMWVIPIRKFDDFPFLFSLFANKKRIQKCCISLLFWSKLLQEMDSCYCELIGQISENFHILFSGDRKTLVI